MGGAIASLFASTYPSRVQRLALLAPAGLHNKPPALIRIVGRLPFLRALLIDTIVYRDMCKKMEGIAQAMDGPLSQAEVNKCLNGHHFLPSSAAAAKLRPGAALLRAWHLQHQQGFFNRSHKPIQPTSTQSHAEHAKLPLPVTPH
jgi:pimeloyl-ACP methyl ester carboxylesterase